PQRDGTRPTPRPRLVSQSGKDAAPYLAHELPPLEPTALMSLGSFQAVARLSIGGRSSEPFTLQTLPPCGVADAATAAETVAASARRFARPVTDIDRELEAAIGSLPEDPGSEDSRGRKERGAASRSQAVPT